MFNPNWLGVRPKKIKIGGPANGHFDATVTKRIDLGGTVLYGLGVGDLLFAARVPTDGALSLPDVGARLSVSWPARTAWPLA